uniref:Uncharacterized protein n=1 Tax=Panagrolaimus sp. ES5 TaxID=591445 RepID=A0AC34G365_9BILA
MYLIGNVDDCEAAPGPYAETVYSGTLPSMRYSTAGSTVPDDCSSYYGPPACGDEEEEYKGCLCKDANLRANIRVIIGSILLTIIGTALFAFGFFVMVFANEIGREGYSFNNLSTFRKPPH